MDEYQRQEDLRHLSELVSERNLTYELLQRIEELDQKNRMEEKEHQWDIEQQRIDMTEKYRREDKERQDENDLDEFLNKYNLIDTPQPILEQKVLSLIRRFSPLHKSLLIESLYKADRLNKNCNYGNGSLCYLSLSDADLSEIQLRKKDTSKIKIFIKDFFIIIISDNCPNDQYNYLYLRGAYLMNASFDCLSLNNADFTNAHLNNASFVRSSLYNASFLFSDLNKCNFQEAEMDGITLFGASLLGTQFQRASLKEAQFLLIKGNWSDFSEANLAQSSFTSVVLTGARFDYTNISEVRLASTYLENASFYKAYGNKGDFTDAHLTNTSFREASLLQSEFVIASGNRTDFSNAILDEANLRYAHLREALLYNASMNKVPLYLARIIDSNLRHASLIEVDFTDADLSGSDFSEANLNESKGLTEDQLDTVFSISNAILPNGTIGKNKNLIKYGHPICNNSTMIMNISEWISSQISVITTNNNCVFQSTGSYVTTMVQLVDISGYVKRMIAAGSTNILVEIDVISGKINANLRLFDSMAHLIDQSL